MKNNPKAEDAPARITAIAIYRKLWIFRWCIGRAAVGSEDYAVFYPPIQLKKGVTYEVEHLS